MSDVIRSEIQIRPPSVSSRMAASLARAGRKLAHEPLGLAGFVILGLLCFIAIFAPLLAPYDPAIQALGDALQPPSLAHLAGTDEFGRDILSRLIFGTRITIQTVLSISLIVGPIGLLIGVVAGFFGGRVDALLMRATDIVLSFPSLILALAFAAALGAGLTTAIIAISLTAWPPIARLARAEALVVRNADYVVAARLYGASPIRILFLYIAPMCVPSVIVRLTLNMAGIILTAASLGFLGLGAQPPAPEWGAMISSGRKFMLDYWWVAVMPGIAILLTSLAFNIAGDALRDILDPRHARS
ncbi:ABC transporter permease [Rhizobium anhuiense]|jgi:peptide/nickel transport system permease protein|uniref:ABC transporter permease n=1 Tax=Rhizobium anhuiense TaxID=1184720 RepID=A0ABX4J3D4_9HYPH|nr:MULTISPECIES: ABC transporter permease [Rhizobium]KZS51525.1 D-ala-D-ala transporter subunit [Rhizobium anhuiense bv. trifolii]MBB3299524.1 peptide/nickel transport system permease protein [Rhizobium sp. BK112]MBB3369208.1 peptide/nickel transport system permease protein [Rhizobium sp. BK077]MBB3744073.1 peptide/nickel transport system permease protein [Rhizobium sp. BK591]MBB4113699.1 peptide/nickel transport system permease protein [Rhizobium sp. BK226]